MTPSDSLLHPSVFPSTVALPPVESPPASAVETVGVLHLINGEYYAGAERVQDLLAKHLPSLGYAVGFACVKLDLFDEMRQTRQAPLYDVRMASKFDLRSAWKVAELVRRHDYRLLHSHTVRTAMIGAAASAMTGVPLVHHAHSPASHDSTRRWTDRFNGVIERLCLRRVARVIAVSQAMAQHIEREGFDRSLIRIVPNGVPGLTELPKRRPPEGQWTLGVVALFRPRKGIEILLDAMAKLRRDGLPIHLRAVGAFESPRYASEIAARVEKLGLSRQVTWTGFTCDVAEEMQRMDLLVLPSLFGEGLPMVVLEAMAAGVPVVATRVSGIPEAIRDGLDGLIVAPNDASALADAVAGVVRGRFDWDALRRSGFERHAQMFSDRGMAAGVAAVYRELLPS